LTLHRNFLGFGNTGYLSFAIGQQVGEGVGADGASELAQRLASEIKQYGVQAELTECDLAGMRALRERFALIPAGPLAADVDEPPPHDPRS